MFQTYKAISKILDPNPLNSLEDEIKQASFNWGKIVQLGSAHLVLPTIYYNLKKKKLLPSLPSDLAFFLKEIAELNSNKNDLLLEQVFHICELFNQKKIEFVFLKGAALLGMDLYENIGERMIGDIDILVHENQVEEAFNLLLENGYSILQNTPGYSNLNPKHKPRIVHEKEDFIYAVEIHNRLFENYEFAELNNKNIISNRILLRNIWLPKIEHLFLHNILNWQINDNGVLKKTISFRSIYDNSLFLKIDASLHKSKWLSDKPFTNYLSLYSIFYPNFKHKSSLHLKLSRMFFIRRLKSPFFGYLWGKAVRIKLISRFLSNRVVHFIRNKKYRNDILTDKDNSFSKLKKIFKN